MQLSYPPDLPPDYEPATEPNCVYDESDTFAPIKRSFAIGQRAADDDDGDGGGGESSSLSDSVSSRDAVILVEPVDDSLRHSYSSSDSEQQQQHVNGHRRRSGSPQQRPLPVPAPRLSKLYNGGGTADATATAPLQQMVVRRRKHDDEQQQPELLKVFARRSLKLGKDGEPELLLLAATTADDDDDDDDDESKKIDVGGGVVVVEGAVNETAVADVEVVDVNENHQRGTVVRNSPSSVEVASSSPPQPQFKRIQQRREEWEKRLLQQ